MSDGGGGGQSSNDSAGAKGGGESGGFPSTNYGGPTTMADIITSGPSTSMPFGFSSSFSPDAGGAIPSGPSFGSDPAMNFSTSSIANPQGITGGATAAGPSAAAIAPPFGTENPMDLTSTSFYDTGAGAGAGQTAPLTPEQMRGPGPAPAAAAQPAGEKSVLESLGIKNPLGAAIGAAGLGYTALQGQQTPKFSPELMAQAARLDANGQKMMAYLQSGDLPPGLKASLDQATAAAKAKIISNFASQGLNVDPTQNSALAQQLAQVDQQALISTAQIGQQLMQTGLAQTGLSSDLYKTLANIDQTQTAAIGKSIANFAAAISGSGGGLNLKLG